MRRLGNAQLAKKNALAAAEAYTSAIELDPSNAVYYCNRAAAFTMQEDYSSAIEDCMAAISLNGSYAKAYGRLGAAYLAVGNRERAQEAYREALRLEPSSEAYARALGEAEAPPSSPSAPQGGRAGRNSSGMQSPFGGGSGLPGGLDMASLMSNPEIMKMASQMMGDPEAMRKMMSDPQMASMYGDAASADAAPNHHDCGTCRMQSMMGGGAFSPPPPAARSGAKASAMEEEEEE